jgi:hypothetical protein
LIAPPFAISNAVIDQLKKDFQFIEVEHFNRFMIEVKAGEAKPEKPTLIYLSSLSGLMEHVVSHTESLCYILYQYDSAFLNKTMVVNYVTLGQQNYCPDYLRTNLDNTSIQIFIEKQ